MAGRGGGAGRRATSKDGALKGRGYTEGTMYRAPTMDRAKRRTARNGCPTVEKSGRGLHSGTVSCKLAGGSAAKHKCRFIS